MAKAFTVLEKNILASKGLTPALLKKLVKAGVATREDFKTVGDAKTLKDLVPGISIEIARAMLSWASGGGSAVATGGGSGPLVIESPDAVYCSFCRTKQPKDYKSGDLCVSCGKQAEPILTCYWCAASGPGKFCRQCGAEFVSTFELDLAVVLKREGLPKDDIPKRLAGMSASDKEALWGRVRKSRG
jgi:hypothetical protein